MKPKKLTFLIHLIGWTVYTLLTLLNNTHTGFWYVIKVNVGIAPLYYVIALILARHFRGSSWWWGMVLLLALYPFALAYCYGYIYRVLPLWNVQLQQTDVEFSWLEFVAIVTMFYLRLIVYAALIETIRRTYAYLRYKRKAEHERDASRDAQLRFRISTHFQANALNVMASHAVRRDDRATAEMVKHMASLQRYSMETADDRLGLISIRREMEQLSNFVRLVNLQHGRRTVLEFSVSGKWRGQVIPPTTLLTIADNMERHGALTADHPGVLHLSFTPGGYTVTSRNRIAEDRMPIRERRGGTGLANIRQRMDLLLPGQYTLVTNRNGNEFILILTVRPAP